MAETVKKSRIVSEDDLEESLMQEFNMRLMTCMSSDKLNDEEDEEEEMEEAVYENVEVLSAKEQLGLKNKLNSIEEFIQIERECLKLEQNGVEIVDAVGEEVEEQVEEQVEEHVEEHLEEQVEEHVEEHLEEQIEEQMGEQVEEQMEELVGEVEQVENDEFLGADEDEVVTDLDAVEECQQQQQLEIVETLEAADEEVQVESKSVKDRMFLSTDSACLLFTQTVTSPMLTPSEERVDFIRGFQTEPEQNTLSDDSNVTPKSEEEPYVENGLESLDLLKDVPEKCELVNGVKKPPEVVELVKRNPKQKYIEVITKETSKEPPQPAKVTECKIPSVKSLKDQYIQSATSETPKQPLQGIEKNEISNLKTLDIMKHISKFEQISPGDDSTETTERTYVETTTTMESKTSSSSTASTGVEKSLKKKKSKKSRSHEKENISVKSSFSKFDALQKKNVLHVRSSDSSKAQEKFNGNQIDNTNCKSCGKIVFQMEQMKAEKSIWHKNCFRCTECNKQLTVDTYQSHEGTLYCKPHFKALFTPKAVEDDAPQKPRKHELIIRENQPQELPPDVVRASDKPDLGLEELQSLNVKERFQVFEHYQEEETHQLDRSASGVNVKRSPSILSKLARFQAKGMDIGVADESLNGIPIEESSTDEEEEVEEIDGEDADLIRAKRAQREKPFHFVGMSDVKSKWEHGDQNGKDERREERKQEIQSIRNRLFMGKQGKMKEAYQQAVLESESGANVKKTETIEVTEATRSLKEKFEKGEVQSNGTKERQDSEDMSMFESGISKKSRSIFLELDANAAKPPQLSPTSPAKTGDAVRKGREVFLERQSSENVVKSTEAVEDVTVRTADIQQRFKFFETYKEPEKKRKAFRITPPREGQVKTDSPEREVYRDPDVVRSEEYVEDSVVAKQTQTAKKMLNKFRQMEEDLSKDQVPLGPKPLKCFTPPPEPIRSETESEDEDVTDNDEDDDEDEDSRDDGDAVDNGRTPHDDDLIEAQKAARAKQLRAKFEKWEANEIRREQTTHTGVVSVVEEFGDEQSQIESTKSLRARFESMKEGPGREENNKTQRVKVNRFVDTTSALESCQDCKTKVYPLEKISVHGATYHKKCFKCMECHAVLRMDSYSYNQGLLYCTPHFKRLFITKGNYDTAFGLEQHKEKWNASYA